MTSEAAKVAETFLSSFAAGDVGTALSCFDPAAVIDEALGLPFSGTYHGPDGFLEILGKMSADLDAAVESVECFDAGVKAIGRATITFASKASGRTLTTTLTEIYTVVDGLITHVDVYYKDPGGISALASEDRT